MRKREAADIPPKCGRLEDGCKRYGLGGQAMREHAEKAGASLKIGKAYLIDFDVMDAYIDRLRTGGATE